MLSQVYSDSTCGLAPVSTTAETLKTTAGTKQQTADENTTADIDWKQALNDKVILGHYGKTVTIGRSNTCMLQIGSKTTTISRRHAEITHKGDDHGYELHVLGFNGVRVNGKLCVKDARLRLNTGDEINFVGIRFRFREPAVPKEEAEEWWPEPMRKRRAGEDGGAEKHIRLLGSEGLGLESSADTLVGGSEIGAFDGSTRALPAMQIINCLPPSSPPPMLLFEGDDDYDDAVDELGPGHGGEPLPEPTADAFAAQEDICKPEPKQESPPVVSKPAKAIKPIKQIKLGSRAPSTENKENNKENLNDKQAAKPGKAAKTTRTPNKAGKKHDDEMMASLRELLGIVDPSECLANSIDSETEAFLTHRPEHPLSLPPGSSLVDLVVQTMVFSARTSHTISDLLRDMAHADGPEAPVWRHHLTWTLFHSRCFGRVERRVKDASDRRAEDKWYYDAAQDECAERRANFGGLVRTARRCTLRDTQYFFKQVPKLPSFRYK
ncbi:hypothetical protein J3B02_004022 [Coemansia erecta]|nr:hypothetical protein J3B02_004022 [Coemansia erecta]